LVLLLARLYQALPYLAPNMRSCLDKQGRDQSRRRGKSPGKLAVASFSTEVEERLAKESERLFRIWSNELLARYSRELEEGLAQDALLQLPAWDKVTITVFVSQPSLLFPSPGRPCFGPRIHPHLRNFFNPLLDRHSLLAYLRP